MTDLSIVIPMMNEADGVDRLFEILMPILRATAVSFEVVCVDDGSTDETVARLQALQAQHPEIAIVELSRNFGKEAALTAGIFEAVGQAVIPMDADLQDPPELIPQMIDHWRRGAEVVLAVRSLRASDSWFKRKTAGAFYRVINLLGEITIPANAGDFRLMDRRVIEAIRAMPERSRFNKGIFSWVGFRTVAIQYERPERHAGTTKWKYRKLLRFAMDGIISFSSLPLRVWSLIGMIVALGALVYGGFIIFKVLVLGDRSVPGYASLMTVMLFTNGIVLIGLGVIGEYLSQVFTEVKRRPIYLIRSIYRNDQDNAAQD